MSEETSRIRRQWVSVPGGSCDVRVGDGALEASSSILKTAVGRPRLAVLLHDALPAIDDIERLRRELTDAGFEVRVSSLSEGGSSRTMDALSGIFAVFAEAGLTSDDLAIAFGGGDLISVAGAACKLWCGGVTLASYPLDLATMIEIPVTPRELDVPGLDRAVDVRGLTKFLICDTAIMDLDVNSASGAMARAIMVASAMAESEKSFSKLWDRAPEIMEGEKDVFVEQAIDALKARGKLASSTAQANRQSLDYGKSFMHAMRGLVPDTVTDAELMGEALRFAARISAGLGKLSVDDVLAQDELLDTLDIESIECDVEPQAMLAAIKRERFSRTNRFQLATPQALGRIRYTAVDDELLGEHIEAWCAAHATE